MMCRGREVRCAKDVRYGEHRVHGVTGVFINHLFPARGGAPRALSVNFRQISQGFISLPKKLIRHLRRGLVVSGCNQVGVH
jgi:hypothetical protein